MDIRIQPSPFVAWEGSLEFVAYAGNGVEIYELRVTNGRDTANG